MEDISLVYINIVEENFKNQSNLLSKVVYKDLLLWYNKFKEIGRGVGKNENL